MAQQLAGPPRRFDPIAKRWGDEIRYRRENLTHETQAQLAARLGVHQTTVSQIERGVLSPAPELQVRIIEELGFDDRTIVRLVRGVA